MLVDRDEATPTPGGPVTVLITHHALAGRRQDVLELLEALKAPLGATLRHSRGRRTVEEDPDTPGRFTERFDFPSVRNFELFDQRLSMCRRTASVYALLDECVDAARCGFSVVPEERADASGWDDAPDWDAA